jgi:hypothetical protein
MSIDTSDSTRASNNKIGEKPPSEILRRALCPSDIFDDNFPKYRASRLAILVKKAKELMGS